MKFFRNFFLSKNIKRKFSTLEWLYWSAFATYYPMVVIYLRTKGFSNTIIGNILAINSLAMIVALPFWGMVSDYIKSIKKVFILCFGVSVCLILSLPLFKTVFLIGIAFMSITFFESSMFPLLDTWTINAIKHEKDIHYGNIRMYGSLGWAVTVPIASALVNETSINIVFPIFAFFGIASILWSLQIADRKETVSKPSRHLNIGLLLKNTEYVTFLIFALILFIPFRAAFFFLPNAMEELNGSQTDYGFAMAATALSEVPVFLFSKHLIRRFNADIIILISCIFFILRQLFYFIAHKPFHLILVQSTQGLTWGLFLTAVVYYIDSLAPPNLKSTAQTVAVAGFFGISGVLGSLWGGWAIDNLGLKDMYIIGFYASIATTIFFLTVNTIRRNRQIPSALKRREL